MSGISEMIFALLQTHIGVSAASTALLQSGRTVIDICPRRGKNVVEGKKSFFCEGYYDRPPCGFVMWKNGRFFSSKKKDLMPKIAAALLKNGRIRLTKLYSENHQRRNV